MCLSMFIIPVIIHGQSVLRRKFTKNPDSDLKVLHGGQWDGRVGKRCLPPRRVTRVQSPVHTVEGENGRSSCALTTLCCGTCTPTLPIHKHTHEKYPLSIFPDSIDGLCQRVFSEPREGTYRHGIRPVNIQSASE